MAQWTHKYNPGRIHRIAFVDRKKVDPAPRDCTPQGQPTHHAVNWSYIVLNY